MLNEQNLLHRFKVIAKKKKHINYKGENGNFALGKSDTHYLNPVVKLNIIYNGTNQNCIRLIRHR